MMIALIFFPSETSAFFGVYFGSRQSEDNDSVILDLQLTSLPPCWWTITKDSSLASIVSSTNMAATSLLFDSRGIDCKSRIVVVVVVVDSVSVN